MRYGKTFESAMTLSVVFGLAARNAEAWTQILLAGVSSIWIVIAILRAVTEYRERP